MESMRSTWTDSRLDDFAKHTDQRFDTIELRMDEGFREIRSEIGALHRVILQIGGGLMVAVVGVIATQL
jgi:hypothetical protein